MEGGILMRVKVVALSYNTKNTQAFKLKED